MSAQIFISYRRDDAAAEAGRICSTLRLALGDEAVFMDATSLPAGTQWPQALQEALTTANTLIAVIGPGWLQAESREGRQRRLDQETDWVRQELAIGLMANKVVIPVLVRGATLPPGDALPDCINTLPHRQKLDIRTDYWEHDIQLLLRLLPGLSLDNTTDTTPHSLSDRPRGRSLSHHRMNLRQAILTNVERFLLILAHPQRFLASLTRASPDHVLSASLFAIAMSVLGLLITVPALRLLQVQMEHPSYILLDTTFTFAFWFLYGSAFHLCAKLVRGHGTYASSLCVYLYLRAFSLLIILFSLPIDLIVRQHLLKGANTLSFAFYESLMRDLVDSPVACVCTVMLVLMILWVNLCLVRGYMTIHRVGWLRGMMIGAIGISLNCMISVVLEAPVTQILWKAYLHNPL
jgi:hypothetical protein